jgi:hypothetical protein
LGLEGDIMAVLLEIRSALEEVLLLARCVLGPDLLAIGALYE